MTEQTLTVKVSEMGGAYSDLYRLSLKSQGQESSFASLTVVDLLVLVAHIKAVLR